MLKKFCARCTAIVPAGQVYCQKHQQEHEARQAERRKRYDDTIRKDRDKQYSDFYRSNAWRRTAAAAAMKDNYLCQVCLKQGKIKRYHSVHHIIPIKTKQGWKERYNLDGLISVCERCHKELEREASENKVKEDKPELVL